MLSLIISCDNSEVLTKVCLGNYSAQIHEVRFWAIFAKKRKTCKKWLAKGPREARPFVEEAMLGS